MSGPSRFPARLGLKDLNGADVAVVHIVSARIVNFGQNYLDDKNKKVALTFAEFPDREYILNATSYRLLVDRYGEQRASGFRGWEGKLVVLAATETDDPNTGNRVNSLWVADQQTWNEVYADYTRGNAAATKATAPKGPRRRPKAQG